MAYRLISPRPIVYLHPPPVEIVAPGLYRVEFKVPKITGLMHRLTIYIPGYNRYDAFYRALPLIPPYSKITKVKRIYP
jgi:hypothetical protein